MYTCRGPQRISCCSKSLLLYDVTNTWSTWHTWQSIPQSFTSWCFLLSIVYCLLVRTPFTILDERLHCIPKKLSYKFLWRNFPHFPDGLRLHAWVVNSSHHLLNACSLLSTQHIFSSLHAPQSILCGSQSRAEVATATMK